MTIEAFYQANILNQKNPVFVALQDVSVNREKKVPGSFYFSFVSSTALNDSMLNTEDIDEEVLVAEHNDYALCISDHMEDVYASRPIFFAADDELTGEWRLAGWLAK